VLTEALGAASVRAKFSPTPELAWGGLARFAGGAGCPPCGWATLTNWAVSHTGGQRDRLRQTRFSAPGDAPHNEAAAGASVPRCLGASVPRCLGASVPRPSSEFQLSLTLFGPLFRLVQCSPGVTERCYCDRLAVARPDSSPNLHVCQDQRELSAARMGKNFFGPPGIILTTGRRGVLLGKISLGRPLAWPASSGPSYDSEPASPGPEPSRPSFAVRPTVRCVIPFPTGRTAG
jgi:hypothetical protein